MRRVHWTRLLPAAVLVALALLLPAYYASSGASTLRTVGLVVLLAAPWGLAVGLGVRALRRRQRLEALLALALVTIAVVAAWF